MDTSRLFDMASRDVFRFAGLIAAYVALAGMSLSVAFIHSTVSPVWPATGLAIAALTLGGLRLWPAIAVGACAANYFIAGNPLPVAAGIAVGNTLEAIVGAMVLYRLGVKGEVKRVRDAAAILAVAALAPLPAATVGVFSVTLGGYLPWDRYPWVWLVWWLGDFMGALIVLPLLLAWGGERSPVKYPHRPFELAGALVLAVILVNVWNIAAHGLATLNVRALPLTTFLFPPVLWAMLRLPPRQTLLVLAGVSGLAVAYTKGITADEALGSLLWLQMLLLGFGGSWLLLLGALAERDQSQMALRESEAQLRATFEQAAAGIAHFTLPERRFLRVNAAFCRIMGYGCDELLARSSPEITHPDDRLIGNDEFARLASGEISTFSVDKRYVRKDGQIIWARASVSLVQDAEAGPFAISVVEDITEATLVAQAHRDAEHRLELAVDIAKLGFWEWDVANDQVYLSPMWKQQLGYQEDELDNRSDEATSRLFPEDIDRVKDYVARYIGQPGSEFSIDYRLRHRDGHYRWFTARATPVTDDTGQVVKLIGTQLDITHLKEAEQRIREAALHDPLTGLPNRALIFEYGQHLLAAARRSHGRGALLFIDLDRFKQVNDLYGHEVGDRLLQEVAMRLIACTRQEDLVGRLGGDEFVIILPHLDHRTDRATVVAQHVLDSIGQPFRIDALELSVSPSIGITYYPEHGTEIDALIHAADLAMYQAKQFGRANYQLYTSDLCQRAEEARSLEAKLRHALKNQGLALHYQPVIDIKSGRLIGVEALVRMAGDDAEDISPATFIPIAESSGLIVELGEWVAIEACRQHKLWRSQGLPPVKIAINVSPLQLRQRAFAERLGHIIGEAGIDPACFEIEVTESALMESVDEAIEILEDIKCLGVRIALDDFGTGHSSLSNLSTLPLDKLKIDQSFVRRIERDQTSRVITNAIISLARTLHLEVVGEGIESNETLRYLDDQACDQAQGFLFSKPLPADAFAHWYRQHAGQSLH
ncbi:EAL domain-containing protein [Dechloromonas sp. XY25]|uniref:EAL domain-containing protein n=1 Tax=Dechloromonas hankyongensis TaxID=2908002 RepID=A0ABS9K2K0_9RHOO|nr:EAL domain-containing protein [Dechloromonas hankyongensis]MCG2577417.1 EAL domain-containing protein [Dechloromonas hankyongensis]